MQKCTNNKPLSMHHKLRAVSNDVPNVYSLCISTFSYEIALRLTGIQEYISGLHVELWTRVLILHWIEKTNHDSTLNCGPSTYLFSVELRLEKVSKSTACSKFYKIHWILTPFDFSESIRDYMNLYNTAVAVSGKVERP